MTNSKPEPAVLALADGKVFKGLAFGARRPSTRPAVGEVVFNTSMYGYQEILTDPSYAGQLMSFTSPHIGNVGCNPEDVESTKVHAGAVIVRENSAHVSNFRAKQSFTDYLAFADVPGISDIDTRALVMHLRDHGSQMGAVASGHSLNIGDLVDIARAQGSMEGKDYVKAVSCVQPYTWDQLPWKLPSTSSGPGEQAGYKRLSQEKLSGRPHVVVVDCGVKYNMLRLLLDVGFRVSVVPATSTKDDIMALSPDALFLSNGPGDPATLDYVVKPAKELLGRLPIFGICLGHQILGQAVGGKTYKLKFGHRGGNHPVKDLTTGKVEITVQNHGFAVDPDSVPKDVSISHVNLHDRTVEGLVIPELKAFCVQYHPESSPGPHDARYLFRRFFELVANS
jgi:carbamoyl-phosphate synthase small subunit